MNDTELGTCRSNAITPMATSATVNEPSATSEPKPSTGEEIANSVSHAVGVIAVLVAGPLLIIQAGGHGKPWGLSSAIVFVTTVLVMYVASTLYHSLPQSSAKRFFRTLEHCAIFLLIAGTYTPFTLVALRGVWGWAIFGVVWTLAALGILLQCVGQTNRRWLPGVLYLGLAWVIVLAIRPLSLNLSHAGLMWLLGGGVAYTVGMAFFAAKWVPYCHFVWHLFVLAGTTCHFIAIWQYVI